MPSIIDQIREQQAWEQPKKSSSTGFIAGTIAAFVAGILLVMGWGAFPLLSIKVSSPARQTQSPQATPAPAVPKNP
jgi:hypothetical protein